MSAINRGNFRGEEAKQLPNSKQSIIELSRVESKRGFQIDSLLAEFDEDEIKKEEEVALKLPNNAEQYTKPSNFQSGALLQSANFEQTYLSEENNQSSNNNEVKISLSSSCEPSYRTPHRANNRDASRSLLSASKMTSNFKLPLKNAESCGNIAFISSPASKSLSAQSEIKHIEPIALPAKSHSNSYNIKTQLRKSTTLSNVIPLKKRPKEKDRGKEKGEKREKRERRKGEKKEKEKEKDRDITIQLGGAGERDSAKWKRGAEAEAILSLLKSEADKSANNRTIELKMKSNNKSKLAATDLFVHSEEPVINSVYNNENIESDDLDNNVIRPAIPPEANEVLTELILTEKNFITDMEFLFESFSKPLRQKEILPAKLSDNLSLNLECLVAFHKELFFILLKDKSIYGVVNAFARERIVGLEQLYTIYIGHYQRTLLLFYDRRESNTTFRKFLTQINKSLADGQTIANLFVTPVQRVCKYSQLLNSISKHFSFDPYYHHECTELMEITKQLTSVLEKVDHKREIADKWENIINLERNLLVSEPIAIPGRVIINEIEFFMKIPSPNAPEISVKFILFNDCLMRIKSPKQFKKSRVLNIIPFSQLQVIDITDEHCSIILSYFMATNQNNSEVRGDSKTIFYIINSDTSSDIWEVHAASEKEKIGWISELRSHLLPPEKFTEQWKIDKGEKIIFADSGKWDQAYVNHCRFYITRNYILFTWKMFGCFERDLIRIPSIHSLKLDRVNNTVIIQSNSRCYNFTFRNADLMYYILIQLTKNTISSTKAMMSNFDINFENMKCLQSTSYLSFSMTEDEWEAIWELSTLIELQENEDLVTSGIAHNSTSSMFKIQSGAITTSTNLRLTCGELFGIRSFITGEALEYAVIGSVGGARILQLNRSVINRYFEKHPEILSKFFAMLSCKLLIR